MAKCNLKSWVLGIFIIQATCALDASAAASAMADFGAERDYSYSINFMWLNSKPQLDQPYISPGDDAQVQTKVLDPIIAWSQANPRASIKLWYGGMNTSEDARRNTDGLISRRPEANKIELRDIRDLPLVEKNPDVFSSRLPVYFRVDLARVIMLHHLVKTRDSTYAVYADLDTPVMDETTMFDADTLEKVNEYGIVLGSPNGLTYENSFHIVGRKDTMLGILKFAIIDLNIKRAYWALEQGYYPISRYGIGKTRMAGLQQIVYDSYEAMFVYAYALKHRLNIKRNVEGREYDTYGLTHENFDVGKSIVKDFDFVVPEEEMAPSSRKKMIIPIKSMSMLVRGGEYDDGV